MPSDKRDYYTVLGVERNADKEQLRTAYRKLALRYHPDRNKEPDAEVRFKEINEAYEVLNDDEKRSIYDRYGHAGIDQSGQAGGFGFGGFGDIFEDLFGFGGQRSARQGPMRGADLRYDLEIGFEEAVFGINKEIEVVRHETCSTCNGRGAEPGTTPVRCSECNGTGQVRRAQQSLFGSFVNVTTCPRCGGRGEVVTTPCSECHGAQRVETTRKLSVSIPAGVDDGTRVRLTGEGEAGVNGGPAGSLYVVLHVKPHAFFQRRDNDILLNMNINIVQAALGAQIMVPTLDTDGETKLSIPAGTQTGAVFRLKSKGVPKLRGAGRGDEIVIINVVVPTKLDSKQKDLLRQLGETLGTDVSPQNDKNFGERLRDALGL
jgi:molecular chaperone DnaJ